MTTRKLRPPAERLGVTYCIFDVLIGVSRPTHPANTRSGVNNCQHKSYALCVLLFGPPSRFYYRHLRFTKHQIWDQAGRAEMPKLVSVTTGRIAGQRGVTKPPAPWTEHGGNEGRIRLAQTIGTITGLPIDLGTGKPTLTCAGVCGRAGEVVDGEGGDSRYHLGAALAELRVVSQKLALMFNRREKLYAGPVVFTPSGNAKDNRA